MEPPEGSSLRFPTALHQTVAGLAAEFFQPHPEVDTVLVTNSCARGQATPESDLDMAVLVEPSTLPEQVGVLERAWLDFSATHPALVQLGQTGAFCRIHLDVVLGQFTPTAWDDGGGPDDFEIGIGNLVAHTRRSRNSCRSSSSPSAPIPLPCAKSSGAAYPPGGLDVARVLPFRLIPARTMCPASFEH